jgi:hypothetical protein
MFIVRDIFHLKFGHYRDVKPLFDEVKSKGLLDVPGMRLLTDSTGNSYRLIMEASFDSLAVYETFLGSTMGRRQWYEGFKPHVESSYREILKQVV